MTYLHYQLVNKSQLERGHPKNVSIVILRISYSVFSSTELIQACKSKKRKIWNKSGPIVLIFYYILGL